MTELQYLQLIKILLNHSVYLKYKPLLLDEMFGNGTVYKIWQLLKELHQEYGRDLNEQEVLGIIQNQRSGALTASAKAAYVEFLTRVSELQPIGPDVGEQIIRLVWKAELGKTIMSHSYGLINNEVEVDIEKLQDLLDKIKSNYIPSVSVQHVSTDIETLLEEFDPSNRWKYNLDCLQRSTNGTGKGEFNIVFARPETGKDSFFISCAVGPNGWCQQGAKVHILANEERPTRTMLRAVNAWTGLTTSQIRENIEEAKVEFSKVKENINMVDCIGWSMEDVNNYCKKYHPDILVINQIDKIKDTEYKDAPSHERLRSIYTSGRELAKTHDLSLFGVSQASFEAEGKSIINYSMLEGSRTSKAAEADVIIGIGVNSIVEQAEGNNNLRTINLCKNKILGIHNSMHVKIIPQLSRYVE